MAVVTKPVRSPNGGRIFNNIAVAHVTGSGEVRVLSMRDVFHGRRHMSPQQARIAPVTHKIAFVYFNYPRESTGLAVMNVDGSHLRVLLPANRNSGEIWQANWSADGQRIAVVEWARGNTNDTVVNAFSLNAPRTKPHRLLRTGQSLFAASYVGWSHSTLLLDLSPGRANYVQLLRGGQVTRVASGKVYLHDPVAARSGRSFVYDNHLYPGGPFEVREVSLTHPEDSHRVVLDDLSDPAYSPGETRLFYSHRRGSLHFDVRWAWLSGSQPHSVQFPGPYRSVRFGGITNA